MSIPSVIPLSPSVLIWARESLGMTQEDAAQRAGRPIAEVRAWEAGEKTPTFPQLEKLARSVYRRPLAVFFMSAPPDVPSLAEDFRTVNSSELAQLDRKSRLAVREVKARQLYLTDLFGEDDYQRCALSRIRCSVNDDPAARAREVRGLLDYPFAEQTAEAHASAVFRSLRGRLELQRVFTFQADLAEDLRGFALFDETFPVIGINGGDHAAAKPFTLAHELAHLLLRGGDILRGDPYATAHGPAEQFCNRFAAELLVPSEDFAEALEDPKLSRLGDTEARIRWLATKLKVSHTFVARRLLDTRRIDNTEYRRLTGIYAQHFVDGKKVRKASSGGPSYHRVRRSRLGDAYILRAFAQLDRGSISLGDASDILGVKINHFDKLMQEVSGG